MYFVFSDVHGCLSEMNTLLKYWKPKEEKLVFLGDMIDRGEDSYGVVKRLMDLKDKYGEQVIILRGNHDDEFIKWLSLPPYNRSIFYHDTLHETLRSFYNKKPKKFQKDRRRQRADYIKGRHPDVIHFMKDLPYFYETDHCIFVHAGINMEIDDWKKDKNSLLWIREAFYNHPEVSQKRIFSGHTPTSFLNDMDTDDKNGIWFSKENDKVLIDGGCVFGGQLNGLKVNQYGEIIDHLIVPRGEGYNRVKRRKKMVQ